MISVPDEDTDRFVEEGNTTSQNYSCLRILWQLLQEGMVHFTILMLLIQEAYISR
jgi:hypothetical protein